MTTTPTNPTSEAKVATAEIGGGMFCFDPKAAKPLAHYFLAGDKVSLCRKVLFGPNWEKWRPQGSRMSRALSPVCSACQELNDRRWAE